MRISYFVFLSVYVGRHNLAIKDFKDLDRSIQNIYLNSKLDMLSISHNKRQSLIIGTVNDLTDFPTSNLVFFSLFCNQMAV